MGGGDFCVNLSVDVCSISLVRLCRELGALYIDTVVEPWPGYYFDGVASSAERTNYRLRERFSQRKKKASWRRHGRDLLRRQSWHGFMVR